MEIRNLITFTKVAEVQSLSKAAKELDYAQSTVTMQMQQLEQEVGVALYERVGRKIHITSEGQELLAYARHIIRMSEAALKIGKKQDEIVDGDLRIGILEAVSGHTMADRIQSFIQRFPLVRLHIFTEKNSRILLDKLKKNELDLIITLDVYLEDSMLLHANDQKEQVHFYAAHPVLNQMETILFANPETSWECDLKQLISGEEMTQITIQNQMMAISIAERQTGILLLPDCTAEEYVSSGRLCRLDSKVAMHEDTYWMQTIYHKNKWVTAAMKAWLEIEKTDFTD